MTNDLKPKGLSESFNRAFEGLVYCFKTQKSMRLHMLIAILVVLLGVWLNLGKTELILLSFAIALVLLSEMVNTTVELIINLVTERFNPLARIIKDVAAGIVLIASVNAVVVGYLIFSRYLIVPVEVGITRIREAHWHIAFICFVSILSLAIIGKLLFHRGTPMRGGMPSVHSAIAFSIWTIITFVTRMGFVALLAFLMAIMIAQSRVWKGIHNAWEVIAGGILGISITVILFQILG